MKLIWKELHSPQRREGRQYQKCQYKMTRSLTASLCLSLPLDNRDYRSQPSLALPHCTLIFKPCHTAASKSTETGESSNFHSAWLSIHSLCEHPPTQPHGHTPTPKFHWIWNQWLEEKSWTWQWWFPEFTPPDLLPDL